MDMPNQLISMLIVEKIFYLKHFGGFWSLKGEQDNFFEGVEYINDLL